MNATTDWERIDIVSLILWRVALACAIVLTSGYTVVGHWRRYGWIVCDDTNDNHLAREYQSRLLVLLLYPPIRLIIVVANDIVVHHHYYHAINQLASLVDLLSLYQFYQLLLRVYFYRRASPLYNDACRVYYDDKCYIALHLDEHKEERLETLYHHHVNRVAVSHRFCCCDIDPHQLLDVLHYSFVFSVVWQLFLTSLLLIEAVNKSSGVEPSFSALSIGLRSLSLVPLVVLTIELTILIDIVMYYGRDSNDEDDVAWFVLSPGTKLWALSTVLLFLTVESLIMTTIMMKQHTLHQVTLLLTLWMHALVNHGQYHPSELQHATATWWRVRRDRERRPDREAERYLLY